MRELTWTCESCDLTEISEPWAEDDGELIGPPCIECEEPMLPQTKPSRIYCHACYQLLVDQLSESRMVLRSVSRQSEEYRQQAYELTAALKQAKTQAARLKGAVLACLDQFRLYKMDQDSEPPHHHQQFIRGLTDVLAGMGIAEAKGTP